MKNTLIFVLLLAVLAATAALVGTDRTRTATLLGRFSDRLGGVDYRWAYLRDAADDRSGSIPHDPPHSLTVGEKFVFGRVENLQHVVIERANPVPVAAVEPFRKIDPFAHKRGRCHLEQAIGFGIHKFERLNSH